MLYKWYKMGKCGIPLAAAPGRSNHQSGLAIDIGSPDSWQSAMQAESWKRLGSRDPPHYDYVGKGTDVRSSSIYFVRKPFWCQRNLAVKAFQMLWNKHNPKKKIAVDGLYGPGTENAILNVRSVILWLLS